MIITKENGVTYTNGLNLEIINWHKENNLTIAEVNRPLTKVEVINPLTEKKESKHIDDITEEEITLGTKAIREVLYKVEADPLYFKVQRGEIDEKVWLDKVKEIKELTQAVPIKNNEEVDL